MIYKSPALYFQNHVRGTHYLVRDLLHIKEYGVVYALGDPH